MKTAFLPATLALLALPSATPRADVNLSFIEYRAIEQLGQVRITTGFVHDPETQKRMLANLASFDRKGIILIAGESVRRFSRVENIGGHTLQTTLTIQPAKGHGYRGGLATAEIAVAVDGKKKIDCSYDAGPVELDDVDILPLENVASISGTYNYKWFAKRTPLNDSQVINNDWVVRAVR